MLGGCYSDHMSLGLVVMATGGTGGHIYPAVATAKELILRGYSALLLGQKGGMEEKIAAEVSLPFMGVDAGKLARSGQGIVDPRQLVKAVAGVAQARRILAEKRPLVVVGYGGFASLPGILAAQSLGIPTVLHEQNAVLGLTQKLAVRRARAVGTAYKEVRGLDMNKATLVGMPVREEKVERQEALLRLGLRPDAVTVLVMGGSQGSLFLNEQVPPLLRELFGQAGILPAPPVVPLMDFSFSGETHAQFEVTTPAISDKPVQVLHATGRRWLEAVVPNVSDLSWYKPIDYVDAVAAWSVADVAITRAGTSTLAEAAFHGVPLVMVPLPESAENHQYYNGLSVQQAGAGRVIQQSEISKLPEALLACLRQSDMREAARARASMGAAARFADLIERHSTLSFSPTKKEGSTE